MSRTSKRILAVLSAFLIAVTGLGGFASPFESYAVLDPFDSSFETGVSAAVVVDGSVVDGDHTVDNSAGPGPVWTIQPNVSRMLALQPSTGTDYSTVRSLFGFSDAGSTYLTGQFPNTTNFAYMYVDVYFEANQTYSMAWQYVSTDYAPFNDGSFVSFVNTDDPASIPLIDGVRSDVAILGATVLGTGNFSTDSYGATGWQRADFKAASDGIYRIGFAIFNLDDEALSPWLFLDDPEGTTLKDGEPFAPIDKDDDAPPPPGDVEEPEDPPAGLDNSEGTTLYDPAGDPVIVDGGLTLDGFVDEDSIDQAMVMIRNYEDGDLLDLTYAPEDIEAVFSMNSGVLTIVGEASQAEYQAMLRGVRFYKGWGDSREDRVIDFMVGSGLYNDDTGHFYEYVENPEAITWDDAKAAAESMDLYGREGYLATLTDAGENAFVYSRIMGLGWIGAKDVDHPNGDWRWVTGPEGLYENDDLSLGVRFWQGYAGTPTSAAIEGQYENWVDGEPNNAEGAEYVAHIYGPFDDTPGQWNDYAPDNANAWGYVVEYGGMPDDIEMTLQDSKIVVFADDDDDDDDDKPAYRGGDSGDELVSVIVNGEPQNAGTQTETYKNGVRTVTVDVDEKLLAAKIAQVLAGSGGAQENVVEVPVTSSGSADVAAVRIGGTGIALMEQHAFMLKVSHDGVSYLIPAGQIGIGALVDTLNATAGAGDIEVIVTIRTPDDQELAGIMAKADAAGYGIVFPPVFFDVTAVNTKTGDSVAVDRFSDYVQRMVPLPAGMDPQAATTGVVYDADGTFSHIPTQVVQIGDRYYAVMNSLTNSAYAVIYNEVEFADTAKHWAKDAAGDMGSRLVVNGTGNGMFEPERAITRGEFAAMITKALGIFRTGGGSDRFNDVAQGTMFYDAIGIADDYGLIKGYPSGMFEPGKTITREEAMAIMARAAEIVKLGSQSDAMTADYIDGGSVASWAKPAVDANLGNGIIVGSNGYLDPKADISRAEAVTAIQRLLRNAGLID